MVVSSGGTYGFVKLVTSPEAFDGGPIALLVKRWDVITIDAVNNKIDVQLSNEELAERKQWTQPELKVKVYVSI